MYIRTEFAGGAGLSRRKTTREQAASQQSGQVRTVAEAESFVDVEEKDEDKNHADDERHDKRSCFAWNFTYTTMPRTVSHTTVVCLVHWFPTWG